MKILAVIPAHNEEGAIARVVAGVVAAGFDALVVDDGSTDGTAAAASSAGARVIATGQKGGKGAALRRGFDEADAGHYDAVITLDGDGQHDPDHIKDFVVVFASNRAQIVNGDRMSDPRGMPWIRRGTNMFMSWLISCVCGQSIPDSQCGFRLISLSVLRAVRLDSNDFEIESEILLKAARAGFVIHSIPVRTIYEDEISKIRPLRDTWRFVRFMFKFMKERR